MFVTHASHYLKNEDGFVCVEEEDRHILAIADGHGGKRASEICITSLPNLISACSNRTLPTHEEFETIFSRVHDLCQGLVSGSTLTVCVVDKHSDQFVCANVGDSHCYLVTPTSHMCVSTSHRLQENAEERKRLGYSVKIDNLGPPRLYPGGLACSRGIGDYDCPLLCWKPSTSYETLTSQTTLVLASDGIWDCLGTRRVLNTVRVTRHAKTVLRLRSQYTDDATIIVISKERPSPRFGITWFFKSGNGSASSSSEDEDDMIRYPVSLQ